MSFGSFGFTPNDNWFYYYGRTHMINSTFGALGQQRNRNCIGLNTAFLALGQQRSRNCIGLSMSASDVNRNLKGWGTVSHRMQF